jgi:hypothetical protein
MNKITAEHLQRSACVYIRAESRLKCNITFRSIVA